ncbi:hypothetical protein HY631_04815, partial [Candidatus Uhrbacteria bacterium]|nr:hypothetical protein [Candidatus Uhrbacteria bacterium]
PAAEAVGPAAEAVGPAAEAVGPAAEAVGPAATVPLSFFVSSCAIVILGTLGERLRPCAAALLAAAMALAEVDLFAGGEWLVVADTGGADTGGPPAGDA